MKRIILLLLAGILLSVPAWAQTHTEMTLEDVQTITGQKTFSGIIAQTGLFSSRLTASPGGASTLGSQQGYLSVVNNDTAKQSFSVESDTGDGNGMRHRFTIENNAAISRPDLSIRNVTLNIGNNAGGVAGTAVPVLHLSKAGDTGNYETYYRIGDGPAGSSVLSFGLNGNITQNSGGLSSNAYYLGVIGEANPRYLMTEFGEKQWGAGGASALDVGLKRSAAGQLQITNAGVGNGNLQVGNITLGSGNALGSVSGNSGRVAQSSGTLTSGNALKSDASGNLIDAGGVGTLTIASGTSTLTSGAATTNTCQTAITTAATGAATTDAIQWAYATAPGSADALMHVSAYPTTNNVNFTRCNATSASQTGTAIVINWRVTR